MSTRLPNTLFAIPETTALTVAPLPAAMTMNAPTFITLFSDSAQIVHDLRINAGQTLELRLPASVQSNSLVAVNQVTGAIQPFDYIEATSIPQIINGPMKPRGKVTNHSGTWEGTLLNMEGDNVTLMLPSSGELVTVNQTTSVTLTAIYDTKSNTMMLNPWIRLVSSNDRVELSYLMTQINWRATATALLRAQSTRMLLRFTAHVQNSSGMQLRGSLSLVAGQASQPNQYGGGGFYPRVAMQAAPQSAYKLSNDSDASDLPTQVEDYQSFQVGMQELSERLVVLEMFQHEVPVKKVYVHDLGNNTRVGYQFEAARFLPAASVQVYAESQRNRIGTFVGETNLAEKQPRQRAELLLGRSSLVKIESDVVNSQSAAADKYELKLQATIKNRSTTNANIVLQQDLGGRDVVTIRDANFQGYKVTTKQDGSFVRFEFVAPPNAPNIETNPPVFSATIVVNKPPKVY